MVRLIKYVLRPVWNTLRRLYSAVLLLKNNPTLKLGDHVVASNCEFGEYVYLASNVTAKNASLGDFSYCASHTNLREVVIGRFTCIGPNVSIGLAIHPVSQFVSVHPAFYSTSARVGKSFVKKQLFEENPRQTIIGSDVWIGAGVIIPGGIRIGDGAVIASGAVVTKDVASFEIVGGVPAKVLRLRFSVEQRKLLLKSEWWSWPVSRIAEVAEEMNDVDEYISKVL